MLVCDDLVRDVLCRELVASSNAAKAGVATDVLVHLENMGRILMSPRDFVYVPDDATVRSMIDMMGDVL